MVPATAAERGANDEGQRHCAVDVDAEQGGHLAILFAGALGADRAMSLVTTNQKESNKTAVTIQMMICLTLSVTG